MFGRKNNNRVKAKSGAADTLITRDTKITGDIHFKGVLYIDGHVVGDISADEPEMSLLTIGKNGQVEGSVKVPHVIIHGRVDGDVHASEHVELQSSAHIEGNVYYKLIEMAIGGEVNGKMVHTDEKPKLLQHEGNAEESDESKADQGSDNKGSASKNAGNSHATKHSGKSTGKNAGGQQEALLSSK